MRGPKGRGRQEKYKWIHFKIGSNFQMNQFQDKFQMKQFEDLFEM